MPQFVAVLRARYQQIGLVAVDVENVASSTEPPLHSNSRRDIAGEKAKRVQLTRRFYELLEWRQVT